jgi:hypothetical protein
MVDHDARWMTDEEDLEAVAQGTGSQVRLWDFGGKAPTRPVTAIVDVFKGIKKRSILVAWNCWG